MARVTSDGRKRKRALAEAEKLLAQGCVSHNYLHFNENAIEAMLEAGNWSEARRYAEALSAYTRAQPLPFADFFARRGCALAQWGAGEHDVAIKRDLEALLAEARACGHFTALHKIEAALAA